MRNDIILGLVLIIGILLLAFFMNAPHHENIQINAFKTQQMDDLGQPTVISFEPEQEFVVTNNSDGRIIIEKFSLPLILITIEVKRRSDGTPFQVATEIRYDKGTKVKLFKISWKENPSRTLPPAGFIFAMPIEGVKP